MSFSLFTFSSELTCHYLTFSTGSTELTHLIGKNPTKRNIECFWKLMAVCLIPFISRWQCFLLSPKGKFSLNTWIFSHLIKPLHSSLRRTVLPLVVSDGYLLQSQGNNSKIVAYESEEQFSCWKSWKIVFRFKIFFNNLKNHTLGLISTERSQVGDGIVNQCHKYFHVKTVTSEIVTDLWLLILHCAVKRGVNCLLKTCEINAENLWASQGKALHQRVVGMEQAAQGSGPECWGSRNVWALLSDTGFGFGWCCAELKVGLSDPCGILPARGHSVTLWYLFNELFRKDYRYRLHWNSDKMLRTR